jgi:hypothetical protein
VTANKVAGEKILQRAIAGPLRRGAGGGGSLRDGKSGFTVFAFERIFDYEINSSKR